MTKTATRTSPNKRFNKQWLCMCVINLCTFLCRPLQNNVFSDTHGLLVGTMRYFRRQSLLLRAPGNLFLQNQFQKCSNSVPLIGRKIFFWPISEKVQPGDCRPLTQSGFPHQARVVEILVENFREKDSKKLSKSQAVT